MKQIQISDEAEAVINKLVESGLCKDAGEAVYVSLQMLNDARKEKLDFLRAGIAVGIQDIENENIIVPESVESTKLEFRDRLKQERSGK